MFNDRRAIRESAHRVSRNYIETREAIVWDIYPSERYCRVKIQGSGEFIVARYPENWESTPFWLKPQNAVTIRHSRGRQDKIEVIGHGRSIPTALAGDPDLPVVAVGEDSKLGGFALKETASDELAIYVYPGTFRVDAVEYYFGGLRMSASSTITMGADILLMGSSPAKVSFDSASAGYWRYDLIVIGADKTLDVVKGNQAIEDPAMPTVPSGHVKVGHVLINGNVSNIEQYFINASWEPLVIRRMTLEVASDTLEWNTLSTVVTAKFYNQWEDLFAGDFSVKFEIISGNGSFDSTDVVTSPVTTKTITANNSSQVQITYYRGNDPSDDSPWVKATVLQNTNIFSQVFILLLDEFDEPMT